MYAIALWHLGNLSFSLQADRLASYVILNIDSVKNYLMMVVDIGNEKVLIVL